MASETWLQIYKDRNAFWAHDGNIKRPHVEMSAGDHSDVFFDSELIMEDPLLLDRAARELAQKLIAAGMDPRDPMRAVGPAMGAIKIAHDVARVIAKARDTRCFSSYVEKDQAEGMIFKRTKVLPEEKVLITEDVITSGRSVELTANAIIKVGGIVLPYVVCLVNRSGHKDIGGKKILSLIEYEAPKMTPAECAHHGLCSKGSVAIKAKLGDGWERLNAKYDDVEVIEGSWKPSEEKKK